MKKKTFLISILLISTLLCYSQSWTWLSTQNLSYARGGMTAAILDDSIFFSGGTANWLLSYSNTVDIYDIGENTWSSNELPPPHRFQATTIAGGGKVFIAGGMNYPDDDNFDEVNIFTKETGEWTVEYLSVARAVWGSAVVYDNKVYFAGGASYNNGATQFIYTDTIDIYDLETGTWSIENLSVPRGSIGVAAAGGKIYFAGGATGDYTATDVIDIYDPETGLWTNDILSEPRAGVAAVAFDDRIYFAGGCRPNGSTCTVIDVYNTSNNSWQDAIYLQNYRIVYARKLMDAIIFAGTANYIQLWGPGYLGPQNGVIEIYYPDADLWDYSVSNLNPPRWFYAFDTYANKAYFGGGKPTGATTSMVNILEYSPGGIIHVPGDQPTIQAAIDIATHSDTILVDEGTYYENINFMGKAITVASQFLMDGDESHIENTIIDGSQPANPDSASVVSFISGEDTTSVLCGFTIQNGTGTMDFAFDLRLGGGISCDFSGCKIINNRIINNQIDHDYAAYGGGVFAWNNTYTSSVILKNNLIEDNYLHSVQNYPGGGLGGGICIIGQNVHIENNSINSNTVEGRPYGAGVNLYECTGTLNNNLITFNIGNSQVGSSRGAGLYIENNLPGLTIKNNTITNNQLIITYGTVVGGGGIGVLNGDGYEYNELIIDANTIKNNAAEDGGGIYLKRAYNSKIFNNIIQGNESYYMGGGVFLTQSGKKDNGDNSGLISRKKINNKAELIPVEKGKSKGQIPALMNNVITENASEYYGGGILTEMTSSDFISFNNIIYNNTAGSQGNDVYLSLICDAYLYNNIVNTDDIAGYGNWSGEDNIDEDPQFAPDGYHLTQGSPCLDAGITSIEIDEEMYYCPDFDIDGQPRPLNETAEIGVDELLITGSYGGNISQENSELQISPNPTSSDTHIRFTIYEQGLTICNLYDISGVKVKQLLNEEKIPGAYEMEINLSDLPNGVYFITLKTNKGTQTTKMIKL